MEKSKTLKALEHASHRLNELPHRYEDTNFRLIESVLIDKYVKESISEKDIPPHFRDRVRKMRTNDDTVRSQEN